MKKAVFLIGLLMASDVTLAGNVYFGGGVGLVQANDAKSNVRSDMEQLSNAGISSAASIGKGSLGGALTIGFRATDNFGIELGYDYLGSYTLDVTATSGATTFNGTETDKVSAVSLFAVITAPIKDNISIYGKFGVASTTNESTCAISTGPCDTDSDAGTGAAFGVGLEAATGIHGALRIEYVQFNDVGDKENEYTAGSFSTIKLAYIYTP